MNRRHFGAAFIATFCAAALLTGTAQAEPKIGAPAPAFKAVDSNGKQVSLDDLRGKTVVLEWTNDGCPYVRKHYNAGNMQALQKKWTAQDVVWLSVISSPPGEQGFADAARANTLTTERNAAPTAVLLDPKQEIARAYGATVTPHMYIIKPDGVLAYAGAIDDKPTARAADIEPAKNYVDVALTEVKAGKPVTTPATRAYGCVVKYSS
ncbi:MAG: thioredoxin family protein [Pseudolabrys sp.]|nr:thioredoxin family protein [Pseudolabrys sp.]